jgi:hypothetical protein
MTVKSVWMAFLLGAAVAACSKDTAGVLQTPPPLAGLRYFNAVPDTGMMDFRVVDVVSYAPNTVQATFRTGGNPQGITTTFPPPYLSVQAGTRHIRVFLEDTVLATATTVMFDTTVTFVENTNYTFYLYGSARTPPLKAMITADSVPTIATGNIAVRVLNLAPALDGTPVAAPSPTTPVDAFVTAVATTPPLAAPAVANVGYVGKSAYVQMAAGTGLKAAITATGTTGPVLFQAKMPVGILGTTTDEPIAGTLVPGTALTVLLVPRTVAGSTAPAGTAGTVIDSTITFTGTTATARSTVNTGVAVNDIVNITGASDPAFNGTYVVTAVATVTRTAPAITVFTFNYTLFSTPAAAATGARVRAAANDFTAPTAIFLIDQQPPLTAP